MVKRGFDDTASKRDLEGMATKQQLQLVADNLDLMKADIHDMKITLGPLVRQSIATERRVDELEKRVGRVEKKVGIA